MDLIRIVLDDGRQRKHYSIIASMQSIIDLDENKRNNVYSNL